MVILQGTSRPILFVCSAEEIICGLYSKRILPEELRENGLFYLNETQQQYEKAVQDYLLNRELSSSTDCAYYLNTLLDANEAAEHPKIEKMWQLLSEVLMPEGRDALRRSWRRGDGEQESWAQVSDLLTLGGYRGSLNFQRPFSSDEIERQLKAVGSAIQVYRPCRQDYKLL